MNVNSKIKVATVLLSSSVLLAACSDNDSLEVPPAPEPPVPVPYTYEVTVTNLTNAQPLSPVAVVIHDDGNLWTVGQAATDALENMAESGDNSGLLALPVALATSSGAGIIGPGASETISVTINDRNDSFLSTATMLVNTNDAFTGLDKYGLANLAVNESRTWRLPALDAGTEANDEAAGTIPGPADSGEGFNAIREMRNIVTYHPGVVSSDDGLPNSVLDVSHKFDNPVIRLTVTRTQ